MDQEFSSALAGRKNLKRAIRKSAYEQALRGNPEVPDSIHFWAGRFVVLTPGHQEEWKRRYQISLKLIQESLS